MRHPCGSCKINTCIPNRQKQESSPNNQAHTVVFQKSTWQWPWARQLHIKASGPHKIQSKTHARTNKNDHNNCACAKNIATTVAAVIAKFVVDSTPAAHQVPRKLSVYYKVAARAWSATMNESKSTFMHVNVHAAFCCIPLERCGYYVHAACCLRACCLRSACVQDMYHNDARTTQKS